MMRNTFGTGHYAVVVADARFLTDFFVAKEHAVRCREGIPAGARLVALQPLDYNRSQWALTFEHVSFTRTDRADVLPTCTPVFQDVYPSALAVPSDTAVRMLDNPPEPVATLRRAAAAPTHRHSNGRPQKAAPTD